MVPDAVVDPGTVMVHPQYALLTDGAVVGSWGLRPIAHFTENIARERVWMAWTHNHTHDIVVQEVEQEVQTAARRGHAAPVRITEQELR